MDGWTQSLKGCGAVCSACRERGVVAFWQRYRHSIVALLGWSALVDSSRLAPYAQNA